MRILLAKLTAAITALLIVVLAVVFARLQSIPRPRQSTVPPEAAATASADPLLARGRAVYLAQRCGKCHSMQGAGNTRSPLDGVGARLADREIRLWITAPKTMKPGIVKRAYKLPSEDLDALVAYLKAGK